MKHGRPLGIQEQARGKKKKRGYKILKLIDGKERSRKKEVHSQKHIFQVLCLENLTYTIEISMLQKRTGLRGIVLWNTY